MLSLFSILCLPIVAVLAMHSRAGRSHTDIAKRVAGDVDVLKRWPSSFSGTRATWYDVGLGGCGKWNKPDDFIVAMNFPMFGSVYPGPLCFKMITIEYQGKTAQAQIMDACEACPANGGIDMSKGLFTYLSGSLGAGVLSVDWHFSDGGGGGNDGGDDGGNDDNNNPSPSPKPKPKPEPTTTWEPPAPTVQVQKTTSTSSSSSSHTHHSFSSSASSAAASAAPTAPSSSAAAAAPVPTPAGPQNIGNMYQFMEALGQVAIGGSSN